MQHLDRGNGFGFRSRNHNPLFRPSLGPPAHNANPFWFVADGRGDNENYLSTAGRGGKVIEEKGKKFTVVECVPRTASSWY